METTWVLERVVIGGQIRLHEGITTVGRGAACTISIQSDYVSRTHAEFEVTPGGGEIHIRDLGSTNGIFINELPFKRTSRRLNAGDRIGVGVCGDDNQVTQDGQYPIFVLKRLSLGEANNVVPTPAAEVVRAVAQGPLSSVNLHAGVDVMKQHPIRQVPLEEGNIVVAQEPLRNDQRIEVNKAPQFPIIEVSQFSDSSDEVISDKEYDSDDKEDDFVQPQVMQNCIKVSVPFSSAPISNSDKQAVTKNIQTIFGAFQPGELSNLSGPSRAIAEASTRLAPSADVICISSDEEEDERQVIVKSPQLFGDSFNSDGDAPNAEKTNKTAVEEPKTNKSPVEGQKSGKAITEAPIEQQMKELVPESTAQSIKMDDVDENEEEDMYFTQILFDELREELPDPDVEITSDYKIDEQGTLVITPIKQERLSQEEVIDLDDDDEYDEDFETKVNDWSFKLSSQSFSQSFNASQVYEDDEDNSPATPTEELFINVDNVEANEADNFDGVDRNIKIELNNADKPSTSRVRPLSPPREEKEKELSLPSIQQRKRSSRKQTCFGSSSSEDENRELISAAEKPEKEKSRKASRKLSTSDEIPNKKSRLASKSEENENENEQSHKTKVHSKKSSERSVTTRPRGSLEDPFDKVKELDKRNRRPSANNVHITEHRKLNDTSACPTVFRRFSSAVDQAVEGKTSKEISTSGTVYRRSSSAVDEASSKVYMSAKIARRQSHSFVDEHETSDFEEEEVKKPDQPHTTLTKMIRGPPEIIAPPQLPINRGKLRGVSAAQKRCIETIKDIQNQKDLKRKWIEKPDITKKKEKARAKLIKEDRKQRLKELAEKKQSNTVSNKNKARSKEIEPEKAPTSNPKVKCTPVNRGAFLTEDAPVASKKPYKIPKNKKKLERSLSSPSGTTKPSSSTAKVVDERKSSTEVSTNFCKELSKADAILKPPNKPSVPGTYRSRQKSVDVPTEQKERAPPRKNNKKLTFDNMKEHFEQTSRLKEKQEKLARVSIMKSSTEKPKNKKTVRFKEKPEVRWIEPLSNTTRKVYKREPSTFTERKNFIRRRYPVVDHTDELLDNVLSWSHLWLENKKAGLNMDGSDDMIFPMTNQFASISNYNNTIFPLLKIEFLSHLERHMQQYSSKPGHKIRIVHFTQHKDRELLSAKCSTAIKQSELGVNDLVLIDIIIGSKTNQYFGYIGNIRKADAMNCITIEVAKNVIAKDTIKSATQIKVRRIMESIRVYFGSFNAVYQLEQTRLYQKILNPLELLNVKTNWKPTIQYKGCDPLNSEQKEILLKTYAKAIDEFNSNISLIEGPPGTGKSRLITNLALQLLYGNEVRMLDKKILICAQSNMAVDVIAKQLHAIQKKLSPRAPKYQLIRFGHDEKISKDVRDITVSRLIQRDQRARFEERNGHPEHASMGENLNNEILKLEARIADLKRHNLTDVRQDELIEMQRNLDLKKSFQNQCLRPEDEKRLFGLYLENANIVCATLGSCVKLSHYVNYFDVCIIDEATQCTEPWTIMPLKFGITSLILVGDTQQLPATVISQKAKDYGLGTSLFTRIQKCLENKECATPSPILSLHTQYRMHPEICKWPNMYFYKNQLLSAPNTAEFKSQIKPFSILNLEYTQNAHCDNGQVANNLEAAFVAKLAKVLNQYIPNKFFSYGIITPYARHRESLDELVKNSGLTNIMVNTIDSYQGIEKDVIIISNARTQGIGFLANYQRLNVALTRPKKCLILCGNFKNLESVPSWASLLANAKERGLLHDISIADASDMDKNVIEKIKIVRQ